MKKTALALTLILALLASALAGTKLANQAEANPEHTAWHSSNIYIRIESPENKTYRTNNITLSVTSEHNLMWRPIVDGTAVWAFVTLKDSPVSFNLSDGSHTIIANAFGAGAACVTFTIDTTPPNVSVASPENKTYNMFDVPLNFTVSEQVSQIAYSLDGQDNVTVAGNTTLTGLSPGEYNVTVYAQDLVGNVGASETVHFNIAEEPEPFPTLFVAAASVSALVLVGAGLLIYFKKRKR
jgi:hypothetical protein